MRSLFRRKSRSTQPESTPEGQSISQKFTAPQSVDELLATPRRQKLLDHIWQRTALSRAQFNTLYLDPKGQFAFWAVLLTLAVIVIGLLGIEASNDMSGWSHWLKSQATPLLIWRLALYGATAYGWYRMRQRLISEGLSPQQRQRLLCAEVAAAVAISLLELHTLRAI